MRSVIVPILLGLPFLIRCSPSVPIWPQPALVEAGDITVWLDEYLVASLKCSNSSAVSETRAPGHLKLLYGYYSQVKNSVAKLQNVLGLQRAWNLTQDAVAETRGEENILKSATEDLLLSMQESRFVPWKFHSKRASFEPDIPAKPQKLSRLNLWLAACPSADFSPNSFYRSDESYEINIDETSATIRSNSTIGMLRAFESFKQVFFSHSANGDLYTPFAPLTVKDAPRWPHRGLSLDIARNPFSTADIARTIDAMAFTKMNKLHIHATDSQSWPLEIPSMPELASKGAYQPHLILSAKQLSELHRYAASRGVEIYIEIDMPGHTASIAHAFPKLIAAYNQLDWSTFAAEPQSGQLKLQSKEVDSFLDLLLDDLLPRLTPHSGMYHLGGDEVNTKVHILDETVRSGEKDVLQPLVQNFMNAIFKKVSSRGLRSVLWEEMILDWGLSFSGQTETALHERPLVQVWRSNENIEKVLKAGYPIIFGDSKHWYLDCGFGQFLDPFPSGASPSGVPYNTSGGVPSKLKAPYLDYCAPFHNWRSIYMFDPLQNISESLQGGIEGGEVLMWSEQTDGVDLDFKLWPRAAAAAEVLWAGPRQENMIADATRRLGHWRERLVQDQGIASSPVQMTWCLMEGGCEY